MRLWQKQSKSVDYERVAALEEEAAERCRQLNARLDQMTAKLAKSRRDVDDMRNGPGGPDDSAGKARVCP